MIRSERIIKRACTAFILITCLFCRSSLFAQSTPSYTVFPNLLSPASSIVPGATLNLPNTDKDLSSYSSLLREKNKSARLFLKLDLGDDYVKKTSVSWTFTVEVNLNYQVQNGASPPVNKTLIITETAPEMLKIEDVQSSLNLPNPTPGSPVPLNITITAKTITGASDPFLANYINTKLRFTATLEREYDVDVRLTNALVAPAPVISPVTIANRLVTFNWATPNIPAFPNYEIQVVKLYNTDRNFQNNLNQISTVVDWSKALKIETQTHKTNFSLTMAEGTGYYVWRVRPIGNYFKGGIANSENYGEWSYSYADHAQATLNKNSLAGPSNTTPFAFYFVDPDEKINWIYNRVFTEGDKDNKLNPATVKSSEGINYADALLNSKQSQKYNSSENTTIVSQTLNDYSGRPALSTIPVPVSGNLSGYKLSLVKNSAGQLYTVKDFDDDSKLKDPDVVRSGTVGVNDAYDYYSGKALSGVISNSNVASAQGYPYKRTLFKTDGTNRVAEESGIGRTHALGTANDMGKTTRVLFGTPSDDELIRIFGEEAPLAESVIKTITIDPNNVVSVTYTSKEGKTIATALISETADNLLPLNTGATTMTVTNTIDQNTVIDGKIIGSKRIVIPVNGTKVDLAYGADPFPGAGGCAGGNCNLKLRFYLVDLTNNIIYKGDADRTTSLIDAFSQGTGAFASDWQFTASPTYTNVIIPDANKQITLAAGEYLFIKEIVSSNSPEYAAAVVDEQDQLYKPIYDAIAAKMQGVNSVVSYNAFTTWYSDLQTKYAAYAGPPVIPTNSVAIVNHLAINTADLPAGYAFPISFTLAPLTTNTVEASTSNMSISTGCCGTMTIPVPKPDKCSLCTGNSLPSYSLTTYSAMQGANQSALATDPNITIAPYGMEDFTGDSYFESLSEDQKVSVISDMVQIEMINPLRLKLEEVYGAGNDQANLWKVIPGYTYQSLKFMFAHMLASKYYTGQSVKVGSDWYAMSGAGGTYTLNGLVSAQNNNYNYTCKQIFTAWTSALELLNSFGVEGGSNIVSGFNEQDGDNSAQNETDDDSNWEDMSNFQKKYLKKKLSKELEEFSNSSEGTVPSSRLEAVTNLIANFFNSAGYQFAAIIDGKPLPSYISLTEGSLPDDFSFTASSTPTAPIASAGPILTSLTVGGVIYPAVPFLFNVGTNGAPDLTQTTCTAGAVSELFYPYIIKPEWQFKYYAYNKYDGVQVTQFIDDNDALLPAQVLIETNRCYDPVLSYTATAQNGTAMAEGIPAFDPAVGLCKDACQMTVNYSGSVSNPDIYYTHENWSAAERNNFYKEIKGAPRCFENKGFDVVPPQDPKTPPCPTKQELVDNGINILEQDIAVIKGSTNSIKSAIVSELLSSCYTIVKCKTPGTAGQITEKEIDLMVQKVIDKSVAQINLIMSTYTNIAVPGGTPPCNTTQLNASTAGYGGSNNQLPFSVLTECQDLILRSDNKLFVVPNTGIQVTYFSDCDQKILDMITKGSFIPYIPPAAVTPPCPKSATPPVYFTDIKNQCSTSDYEDKTYSNQPYKTYSKTYSVSTGQ